MRSDERPALVQVFANAVTYEPLAEANVPVILNEVKNLCVGESEILRFAQNDSQV